MTHWSKKRRVMRRYDQSARVYDAQYGGEQAAKIRTAMKNIELKKNRSVLDAGCGTGLFFEHIAEKAHLAVGVDISHGLLEEAKKKAKQHEEISIVQADADHLPFSAETFDAVFAFTLLQNMPNPMATLNEIKRVSKTDAVIVVTGLKKAFTEKEFSELLKKAGLKVAVLRLDEYLREYVSVCAKLRR